MQVCTRADERFTALLVSAPVSQMGGSGGSGVAQLKVVRERPPALFGYFTALQSNTPRRAEAPVLT